VAPVAVVLRKIEALLLVLPDLLFIARAKSGFPSPLKSPMLTYWGPSTVPVLKSTLGAKVGVVAPVAVVLSKMEALLLPTLATATARSGFPSLLKSPMA
jgi:hypothetical protein